MPGPNEPPPASVTLLAAAGGGFLGAVAGVVAATTMMGDGDNGDGQAALTQEPAAQVLVVENQD